MAQMAKVRTTKSNTPTNTRPTSDRRAAPRIRPSPNHPARRKRQLTQRMRRFEATLTSLPRSMTTWRQGWSLPRLAQFGFTGWRMSKLLSIVLLLAAVGILAWVHTDDQWFVYRENVQFNKLNYLDANKLYAASGLNAWNIFWVQPEMIRQRLAALPYVTDAQIQLSLPNQIAISVQEAQPAALWVTSEGSLWLLADGVALPAQGQPRDDIPQIIDITQAAKALDTHKGLAIDPNILKSALAIKQHLAEINQLRFDKDFGLNFRLPSSGAWVYWGDGYNLETKFANLSAIQILIQSGKEKPQIIDVRYDRPYIH